MNKSEVKVAETKSMQSSQAPHTGEVVENREDKSKRRVMVPDYRIFLREDAHELKAFMPGVTPKGVSLELEGRFLKVRGHVDEPEWEGFSLSHVEFAYADYQADFKVPEGIDRDNVTGTMKNGILTIHLPKAEEELPKSIHVDVAQN
jgi:HSP20 family molecular chaperone IbpA